MTAANKNTSQHITKTLTDTYFKNNNVLENLNEKKIRIDE